MRDAIRGMSTAPRVATPKHQINDYTVVIPEGAEDGVSEGDEFVVKISEDTVSATAIDVGRREAVLELNRADVDSYV